MMRPEETSNPKDEDASPPPTDQEPVSEVLPAVLDPRRSTSRPPPASLPPKSGSRLAVPDDFRFGMEAISRRREREERRNKPRWYCRTKGCKFHEPNNALTDDEVIRPKKGAMHCPRCQKATLVLAGADGFPPWNSSRNASEIRARVAKRHSLYPPAPLELERPSQQEQNGGD